jgi:hypothetical protein
MELAGKVNAAGNSTMPMAAGFAHGTPTQEGVIKVAGYSSAPTGIVAFVLILWGLRMPKASGDTPRDGHAKPDEHPARS